MLDGDPANWFRILDQLADLQPEAIVPGHGPVSTTDAIQPMKDYMRTVLNAATHYAKKPDMNVVCPAPFDQWMLNGFFVPNVIGLSKKSGGRSADTKSGN
jgi:hypothetical protein